jgi:tetratricopeptide (TPR) repeat protein
MPCPDENQALAFLQGSLPEDQARELEAHLDACPACRALLADLARSFGDEPDTWREPDDQDDQDDQDPTEADLTRTDKRTDEPSAPAAWLQRGAEVDRYVILERLGRGGMGEVYAAYDTRLDRKVALKFLHPEPGGPEAERVQAERLRSEAHAMARLAHPCVVRIYDVGQHQGRVFVSMEHVEGLTLRAWLQKRPRPWREVVRVFSRAGQGLVAAHQAGLLHGDFKPANVLLALDGRVMVTDFGLARPDRPGSSRGTPPGGTPAYMAPEQLAGALGDARADQFSFCVALFEGLTGQRPAPGPDPLAGLRAGKLQPTTRLPAHLRRLLTRGLSAQPEARFASMQALLAALGRDPARTRRRALWGLGLALLLAGAGFGAAWSLGARAGLCAGAEEHLTGVWDAARAAELERVFLATGAPYAGPAFRAVRRSLDAHARAWAAMHTEACQATRVRGEQSDESLDLRMHCLDGRLVQLGALVDLLATADAAVVGRAVEAAQSLDDLSACRDARSLRARAPAPPGPEARVLARQVAEVEAANLAGRAREILAMAQATAEATQALGYPPLAAEAGLALAEVFVRLDRRTEARAIARAAARAALAGRDTRLLIRIWASLVRHAATTRDDLEEAPELLGLARAALDSLEGEEPELSCLLSLVEGQLQTSQRRFLPAVERLEAARSLCERVFGPDHPRTAEVLLALAGAYGSLGGHLAEEVALKREAARIYEATYGPEHPELALVWVNLGKAHLRGGHPAEAILPLERALAAQLRLLGPEHTQLAVTRESLGAALGRTGALEAELEQREAALAIRQRALPAEHPQRVFSHEGLGLCLLRLGRTREAREHFERVLPIARAHFGEESQEVGYLLMHLGHTALAEGRPAEARPLFTRLLAIRERARTELGELYLANPHHGLGRVAYAEGRYAEALERFRMALTIMERAASPPPSNHGLHLAWAGRSLLALGRAPEALPALEEAVRLQEQGGAFPPELADSRFWLARAILETGGDRERALDLSRTALRTYQAFASRVAARPELEDWLRRVERRGR